MYLLLMACGGQKAPVDPLDSSFDPPATESAPPDTGETARDSDSTPPDTDTTPPCDTAATWYTDADGDGWGTDEVVEDCAAGAAPQSGDCDDAHAGVYPSGPERATSGRDDNCDGAWSGVYAEEVPNITYDIEGYVNLGLDVALPGDLNRDGWEDLVLMTNAVGQEGAAFLYFGPLRPSKGLVDGWTADAVLLGDEYDGLSRVANLGDIGGDGWADVVIAGPRSARGPTDGVAYLFEQETSSGELSLLEVARVFWGLADGAYMYELAGPVDVDGDGLMDLVLGASDGSGWSGGHGDIYVLRGPVPQETVADADTVLHGVTEENLAGPESLGDVNGDGLDDLGAQRSMYGDDTSVYVVLDFPDGTYHPSELGVTVYTHTWGNPVVNPVGDVDGDGLADVGVGLIGGSSIAILFSPLGAKTTLDLPDAAAAFLTSANSGYDYNMLTYATSLGDWDGDGHADLVAGNSGFGPPDRTDTCLLAVTCPGAVFLVAGPLAPGVLDLETQSDWISVTLGHGSFGDVLAAGRDLDGDGFPDLVVGDPNYARSYVFFGGGFD